MNKAGQKNAWDRLEAQLPQCGFGKQGIYCRICTMGPCRITKKAPLGVSGADADTIVARKFLRVVAAGASGNVSDYLFSGIEKEMGGHWAVESDPVKAAIMIREHIENKRNALGINKEKERKLYDMADRLALSVE